MKKALYKSTIVIWSEYDPSALDIELTDLAHRAETGTLIAPERLASSSLNRKGIRIGTVQDSSMRKMAMI